MIHGCKEVKNAETWADYKWITRFSEEAFGGKGDCQSVIPRTYLLIGTGCLWLPRASVTCMYLYTYIHKHK